MRLSFFSLLFACVSLSLSFAPPPTPLPLCSVLACCVRASTEVHRSLADLDARLWDLRRGVVASEANLRGKRRGVSGANGDLTSKLSVVQQHRRPVARSHLVATDVHEAFTSSYFIGVEDRGLVGRRAFPIDIDDDAVGQSSLGMDGTHRNASGGLGGGDLPLLSLLARVSEGGSVLFGAVFSSLTEAGAVAVGETRGGTGAEAGGLPALAAAG